MTTDQIKQSAMNLLGFEDALDFTSTTDKAVVKLNAIYEDLMKVSLQRYRWGFALGYSNLTSPTALTDERFDYKFDLPADFLFLRNQYANPTTHNPVGEYIILPDGIYLNADLVTIEYTKRVIDTSLPHYFTNFIKYRLALDLCFDLTGDTDLMSILQQQEALQYINATNIDSRQQFPRTQRTNPLTDVRH